MKLAPPLLPGTSREVRDENIRRARRWGVPHKQAVAMALKRQGWLATPR